jgi:two-component system sensor histidine kinase DesK
LTSPRGNSLLVLYGLFAVQLTSVLASPISRRGPDALGLVLACAVSVFGLQLLNASPAALSRPFWQRLGVLLVQGIVTYLPLAALRAQWPGMVGFFAGSILMLLQSRLAWVLFAVVIGGLLLGPPGLSAAPAEAARFTLTSLGSGLIVYGVWQICLACKRERQASAQVAELMRMRERQRFSRDLHDLLGFTLSAITLKTELSKRLVGSDPAQARDELADVVHLARQAAADVRLVAHGYHNISLFREAATAASLLSTANIDVQVEIGCGALEDNVDALLAIVLREAVTNVLRHSAARNCSIEVSQQDKAVTLAVTNDGAALPTQRDANGYGLENLAWRLEEIGGRLSTVMLRPDGRFCLRATVPMPESPALGSADSERGSGLTRPAPASESQRDCRVPGQAGKEESADQSASSDAAGSCPAAS